MVLQDPYKGKAFWDFIVRIRGRVRVRVWVTGREEAMPWPGLYAQSPDPSIGRVRVTVRCRVEVWVRVRAKITIRGMGR